MWARPTWCRPSGVTTGAIRIVAHALHGGVHFGPLVSDRSSRSSRRSRKKRGTLLNARGSACTGPLVADCSISLKAVVAVRGRLAYPAPTSQQNIRKGFVPPFRGIPSQTSTVHV